MNRERQKFLDSVAENARNTVRYPGTPIINPIRAHDDPAAYHHWEDARSAAKVRP